MCERRRKGALHALARPLFRYRWLEDPDAPEVKVWVKRQVRCTARYMERPAVRRIATHVKSELEVHPKKRGARKRTGVSSDFPVFAVHLATVWPSGVVELTHPRMCRFGPNDGQRRVASD